MKILSFLSLFLITIAWGQPALAKWSVTTYNIRNFDRDHEAGPTNTQHLGTILKDFKSDVMGFVEVVNADAFKKLVADYLPGYEYKLASCGGFGKQKLALAYDTNRFAFDSMEEDLTFSSAESNTCGGLRPAFIVKLKNLSNSRIYVFITVHLKAGGDENAMRQRSEQYLKLSKLMKKYQKQNMVVMGDFNTTGYVLRDQDYNEFERLLRNTGTKTLSENLGCTSYWPGEQEDGLHDSSILDHIVVGPQLSKAVTSIYLGAHCAKMDCREASPSDLGISYQSVSDHCPIQVNFK